MGSRRSFGLALSGALLLGGGGALVLGGEPDDPTLVAASTTSPARSAPAAEEVQSLARDAGVSSSKAQSALEEQRHLPAATEALRQKLGADFGGIWVDRKQRIVVAIHRPAFTRKRSLAQRALDRVGEFPSVRIVPSDHSEPELLHVQRVVEARLERVNRDATVEIQAEPDYPASRVRLRVSRTEMTPAQQRLVIGLNQTYPHLLRITKDAKPGRLYVLK